jgi:hypothetical protein
MTIQEKIEEYDLFDQSITRHGILEHIRDYEVIGYLSGAEFDMEVQYIFKGCIKSDYKVKVDPNVGGNAKKTSQYSKQNSINLTTLDLL